MIAVRINGTDHQLRDDPATPLLWILRDRLELRGTKFNCLSGQCGVCTVLVAGQPVRACVTPLSSVAGQDVLTIEGLASSDGHPLLRAWLAERVPQCGYCQPGQIMTALALLQRSPRPSDAEIDATMSGVLCRCGTYQRIRRAIHRAANAPGKGS
ncbi:MAG: (2Fe-2S)-binding protein [Gammaproteobacteria bacterium SG8_47]|nr:MAG: (2Fe-2S)-binding protein [Gammaproteobacteria bacterium SG8_47]